jgi:preprotein translocase subunit YajC
MPQSQGANSLINLFPLILIFAIFYFLLIRPQKKQEKARQEMLKHLNKNDEVVTTGGIHATVVNVKDKTVILRIDDNVKIEIDRSSIAYIKSRSSSV